MEHLPSQFLAETGAMLRATLASWLGFIWKLGFVGCRAATKQGELNDKSVRFRGQGLGFTL